MTIKKRYVIPLLTAAMMFLSSLQLYSDVQRSKGQTVYVPIYSHIYSGHKGRPFNLTATLSIRNTDPYQSLRLTAVDYYDSEGKLIKKFIEKPEILKAIATKRFIIPEYDKTGGSGANFLVRWEADKTISQPMIESIMIGTGSQQGISFLSRGQVIKEQK